METSKLVEISHVALVSAKAVREGGSEEKDESEDVMFFSVFFCVDWRGITAVMRGSN